MVRKLLMPGGRRRPIRHVVALLVDLGNHFVLNHQVLDLRHIALEHVHDATPVVLQEKRGDGARSSRPRPGIERMCPAGLCACSPDRARRRA